MKWKPLKTASILFLTLLLMPSIVSAQNETEDYDESIATVSDTLRIVDEDWSPGQATIVFEADVSQSISIFDLGAISGSGDEQPQITNTRLSEGINEVETSAERGRAGQNIMIESGGDYLVHSSPTVPLLTDPTSTTVYMAILTGSGASILLTAFMAWRKKRKYEENWVQIA